MRKQGTLRNAYGQVAMTYVRAATGSFVTAILVAAGLCLMGMSVFIAWVLQAGSPSPLALVGVALLGMAWLGHLKEQLASSRARLWPGYRRVHLSAAALLMLSLVGVVMIQAGARGGNLWPATAATVLLALIAWMAVYTPAAHMPAWLSFGWIVFLAIQWVPGLWQLAQDTFVHGVHQDLALALLAAAVLVGAAAFLRMSFLTEETRGYRAPAITHAFVLRPRVTGETAFGMGPSPRWAQWLQRPTERQLRRLRAHRVESLWARARRWQMASQGMTPWVVGLLPVFVVAGGMLAMGAGWLGTDKDSMAGMFLFMLMFPVSMLASIWAQRWRRLGYESLRPVSRPAFLREMGLAMGMDLMQAWVASTLSVVAVSAVLQPELLREALFWQIAGLSLFVWPFGFSIAAWCMRYRNPLAVALGAMGGILLQVLLLAPLVRPSFVADYGRLAMGAVVLMGLLSLPVLRSAYRRWLVTDLD